MPGHGKVLPRKMKKRRFMTFFSKNSGDHHKINNMIMDGNDLPYILVGKKVNNIQV
jgi:hypothetical protein